MMNITFASYFLLFLLLLVPFYTLFETRSSLMGRFSSALLKVVTSLAATAFLLYYLLRIDHAVLTYAFALAALAGTTYGTAMRVRSGRGSFLIPLLAAVFATVPAVVAFAVFAFGGAGALLRAQYVLPVLLIALSAVWQTVPKGLGVYQSGLKNDAQLFRYLLANGATHADAVRYLVRRSVEKTVIAGFKQLTLLFAGVCPWVFCALLLGGVGVSAAAFAQLLLLSVAFTSPVLTLYLALHLAHRYAFDEYGNVKESMA